MDPVYVLPRSAPREGAPITRSPILAPGKRLQRVEALLFSAEAFSTAAAVASNESHRAGNKRGNVQNVAAERREESRPSQPLKVQHGVRGTMPYPDLGYVYRSTSSWIRARSSGFPVECESVQAAVYILWN